MNLKHNQSHHFAAACYSIPTFDTVTVIVGVGGLLIGFVPLLLNRMWPSPVEA